MSKPTLKDVYQLMDEITARVTRRKKHMSDDGFDRLKTRIVEWMNDHVAIYTGDIIDACGERPNGRTYALAMDQLRCLVDVGILRPAPNELEHANDDLGEFTKDQQRLIIYLREHDGRCSHQDVCDEVYLKTDRDPESTRKAIDRLNEQARELGKNLLIDFNGRVLNLSE